MAALKETIDIEAPLERVWAVVHEDFKNAPRWSNNLESVEVLTEGPTRKGTELRYVISTPGGKQELEVEHTTYSPGKAVAGRFVGGPIRGDWKYSYTVRPGGTRLTYTMDYEPNGFKARLFFGLIEKQLPNDVAKTLQALKKYVESGKGPKAAAGRPSKPVK